MMQAQIHQQEYNPLDTFKGHPWKYSETVVGLVEEIPVNSESLKPHIGGSFKSAVLVSPGRRKMSYIHNKNEIVLNDKFADYSGGLLEAWGSARSDRNYLALEILGHEICHAVEFYTNVLNGVDDELDEGVATAYGKFLKNYAYIEDENPSMTGEELEINAAIETWNELEEEYETLSRYGSKSSYLREYILPAIEFMESGKSFEDRVFKYSVQD